VALSPCPLVSPPRSRSALDPEPRNRDQALLPRPRRLHPRRGARGAAPRRDRAAGRDAGGLARHHGRLVGAAADGGGVAGAVEVGRDPRHRGVARRGAVRVLQRGRRLQRRRLRMARRGDPLDPRTLRPAAHRSRHVGPRRRRAVRHAHDPRLRGPPGGRRRRRGRDRRPRRRDGGHLV
ncbi:MAG: hypothetical protein AVDCRST_MAG64-1578, partial [uncultured Phycisphaerae bacterium]